MNNLFHFNHTHSKPIRSISLLIGFLLLSNVFFPNNAASHPFENTMIKTESDEIIESASLKGEQIQRLKPICRERKWMSGLDLQVVELSEAVLYASIVDTTAVSSVPEKEKVLTLRNGILVGIGAAFGLLLFSLLENAEKSPF
ncbi:MAG: hypothetical protein SFU91_12040 [Chloroherpetonaceae bacterium]|nr:hypothetical protein [Chloroherpetonaceae bacterium]